MDRNDNKIIQFPGVRSTKVGATQDPAAPSAVPTELEHISEFPKGEAPPLPPEIPADLQKAAHILNSSLNGQMSMLIIGIKPSATGADFYTAVHGDETDLRNAADHLAEMITRALHRKGIL